MIHAINGGSILTDTVPHCTALLLLQVSTLHSESISWLVIVAKHLINLAFPWMCLYDPQICCHNKEIAKWSQHCFHKCLPVPCLILIFTSAECFNAHPNILSPEVYHDHSEVFSKTKASDLPLHRPYNCAIDLLPINTLPCNNTYPLSITEQRAIEEYVHETL